jgi:hypothetical protein
MIEGYSSRNGHVNNQLQSDVWRNQKRNMKIWIWAGGWGDVNDNTGEHMSWPLQNKVPYSDSWRQNLSTPQKQEDLINHDLFGKQPVG